jgi:hypothetical protein
MTSQGIQQQQTGWRRARAAIDDLPAGECVLAYVLAAMAARVTGTCFVGG